MHVTHTLPFFVRDELKRHYTLGEYWIEVEMEDLASFDEDLSDSLYKLPSENLPLVRRLERHILALRCGVYQKTKGAFVTMCY